MTLFDGNLGQDVQKLAQQSVGAHATFNEFYKVTGYLMFPCDFNDELDDELPGMRKQPGESVQYLCRHLKELVRFLRNSLLTQFSI